MIKDSLLAVRAKIKSGEFSAYQLIAETIAQIHKNTDTNAVLWRDDEAALKRASAVDSGKITGVLAGIPVIIKDNIDVAGLPVTCGSYAFKDKIAGQNAVVVDRLLQHGAIVVGKSNMDEFAMGSSNTTSAFGNVLNPLDNRRVPGGSSGGSAVAVASHQCFAALGSDTGGSIRQPASYCGIVGLKPTYGSVCDKGCFPLAPSMDQIGPLARTVSDCALVYGAICDAGIAGFENIKPIKGRVAVIKEATAAVYGDVSDALNKAANHLTNLGCEVTGVSVPSFMQAHLIYKALAFSETTLTMQAVTSDRNRLGKEVKKRIMAGRYALDHQEILTKAQQLRQRLTDEMNAALANTDVLLLPTAPSVAFKFDDDITRREIEFSDMFTQPASIAGLPSLSVPFARGNEDLPLGIQLVGKMFDEKILFAVAKLLMGEE